MFSNRIRNAPRVLALTIGLFGVAASAHAEEHKSFVRSGVAYSYTVNQFGSATVLAGTADDKEFRLVVKGAYVHGEFNGKPVRFPVAMAVPDHVLAVK
ncbi:MAG: hypothetical protein KGM17_10380 [Sphingomonadales bacterium]|nr:hypothetical protein [Sphingomonadales bacterium]